jgi:hypothetical protein
MFVPVPVIPSEHPVPQSIAAAVFVPLVIVSKPGAPPPQLAHNSPVACPLCAVKHCPFEPTPKRAFTVENVKRSPFVVSGLTVAPPPPREMLKV